MELGLARRRSAGGMTWLWRAAGALLVALVASPVIGPLAVAGSANGCAPGLSRVACENQLPGDPKSDWFVQGAGDPTMQGFATAMSVNVGQTESFKISTNSTAFRSGERV